MNAPQRVTGPSAAVAAALVVLGGLVGGGVVLAMSPHAEVLVAQVPTGGRAGPAAARAVPKGFAAPVGDAPVDQHIPPVEVAVPAIGVRSKLIGLRLNLDGSLEVPKDYGVAGWYSDGPAPGDTGAPAIIIGHVDSKAGPGIFYRLPQLRSGDAVLVRRADGTDVRFKVYRTADYPKDRFPAAQVYGVQPTPELRLITCTGTFDQHTGHYQSNRVVYARQGAV